MSSLLNVSNVSNKPEEFGFKNIEVFIESGEHNWFKTGSRGEIFRAS